MAGTQRPAALPNARHLTIAFNFSPSRCFMNILDLIPGLNALLDTLQRERHHRDGEADAALAALYAATTETLIYLERLEAGKRRNRAIEEELARLWSKAAIPVRRLNADLADRLLLKSRYWLSPERWTHRMVREGRIGIEQVQQDATRLLKRH